MSWLKRLAKAIPGVNTIYRTGAAAGDLATGDWQGAWGNTKAAGYDAATLGAYDTANQIGDAATAIGNGVEDAASRAYNGIKDAYDAPFAQKAAGYQAVQDQAAAYEQQRRAQQQATLAQTLAQYDPARKALAAVYGDPSKWKL